MANCGCFSFRYKFLRIRAYEFSSTLRIFLSYEGILKEMLKDQELTEDEKEKLTYYHEGRMLWMKDDDEDSSN